MPRGGRRENAGKKSQWHSGRTFAETKVIRVPTEFAEQLLDIARRLDAGNSIDLVTNSEKVDSEEVKEEVKVLQEVIEKLQERVAELEVQLSESNLKKKRIQVLASLKRGEQAPEYKGAKKALTTFVDVLMGRIMI